MTQALVLLSGTLSDKRLWAHQTNHLARLAEIQIPCLKKHNHIASLAKDILAGAPETFALAGFSMGGIVAQEILKHAPDRVEKLALLDTSTGKPGSEKLERFEAWQSADQVTFETIVDDLQTWTHLNNRAVRPTIKAMALDVGREVFKRQAGILLSQDNSDTSVLTNYQGQTLIIHGENDPVSSVQGHKDIEELIPDSKRIALENCGHYATLEKPEAVTNALRDWLQT